MTGQWSEDRVKELKMCEDSKAGKHVLSVCLRWCELMGQRMFLSKCELLKILKRNSDNVKHFEREVCALAASQAGPLCIWNPNYISSHVHLHVLG